MKRSASFSQKKDSANLYLRRVAGVQNLLTVGQAVVFDRPLDLFYLTGLHLSAGKLFIDPKGAHLFVDGRYLQIAKEKSPIPVILTGADAEKQYFDSKKIAVLLIDSNQTSYEAFLKWQTSGQQWGFQAQPFSAPLKMQRMVKDTQEITALRKSATLLWKAFQYLKRQLKPGISEKEAALAFEFYARKHGAEGMAFEPIIAFGANSAMPHYRAGKTLLKKNDAALIDIGVVLGGYHSDMTRVVFVGKGNSFLKQMYAIVQEAQQAALRLCRPGTSVGALDEAARSVLRDHGVEEHYVHSLGHGIGIETHEPPSIHWQGAEKDLLLERGMAITIEPGVYFPGKGGVRYEDTVIITERGAENLFPGGERRR